jgi:exopolysaccharide production protein ExoQ
MHLPPIVATVLFIIGIAGLFWLDRGGIRVSKALWIPTVWLLLSGSRPISMWLGVKLDAGPATIYEEGNPVDRVVLLGLEIIALFILVRRSAQVGALLRRNWPIVLFFVYAAFSILWSDDPFVTFKHWIKGIGDVAMVLIVLTEPNVVEAIKRLVTRVGFTLLPLSLLLGKYYPSLGRAVSPGGQNFSGVNTQKNGLGMLCLFYGLGLLWRFCSAYADRQDPARLRRLLALGAGLLMAPWLLWECQSMSSIASFCMGAALLLFSRRPAFRRHPVFIHILVVAMLSTAAYAIFFQSSGELLQDLGKDPTVTGRTNIWRAVLSVPNNALVGVGYESFWLGQRLQEIWGDFTGIHLNEAHNGYIEMYINLGWVGIFLLAGIILHAYRATSVALRRNPDIGGLYLAWLVAAVAQGFAEAEFRMLSVGWIFLLLAAMGASQVTVPSEAYDAPDPRDLAEHEPQADFAPG